MSNDPFFYCCFCHPSPPSSNNMAAQLRAAKQRRNNQELLMMGGGGWGGAVWYLYLHRQHRSTRSLWCRDWLLRREDLGAYDKLLSELKEEDRGSFFHFLRMSPGIYEDLLGKLTPHIKRQDTPFRKAISPGLWLAITLQYLATGFSVEEAVEHMGFGRFQIVLALTSGFAWLADGMEIMVVSILGPILLCEWRTSLLEEALLTTVVFCGFLIGSPVFGKFADVYGRKTSLLFSSCWALYFGVMSSFAPNLIWLYILRMLTGFGVGGAPQAVTYYAEFLPSSVRGKMIILIELFWAIGGMVEVLLAMAVMNSGGWRWWLVASGSPLVIFALFCLWLPESPRYLLTSGRVAEARAVLEQAAAMNGKTLPPGELLPEKKVPRGRISELVKPGFRTTSALLSYIWFASAFCYYGIILLTTDMIKIGDTCAKDGEGDGFLEGQGSQCTADCHTLGQNDYNDLLTTSVAEVPALLLTATLVDTAGRKPTMMLEFLLFSLVSFLLYICMGRVPMIVLLFIGRAVIASSFQVAYVYTPEVYPTSVRALSVGVGSMFGRVGAIITPYVAEVLIGYSTRIPVTVYGVVAILASIATVLLPFETKGKTLEFSSGGKSNKG